MVVILGGKKPFVVLVKSSIADAFGVVIPIPTELENEVTAENVFSPAIV